MGICTVELLNLCCVPCAVSRQTAYNMPPYGERESLQSPLCMHYLFINPFFQTNLTVYRFALCTEVDRSMNMTSEFGSFFLLVLLFRARALGSHGCAVRPG